MKPPEEQRLLDTNILIQGVRGNMIWKRVKEICDPLMTLPKPLVCIVSHGELKSFAEQNNWGEAKRTQAAFLLGYFGRCNIEAPLILDAYAMLDTYSVRRGFTMGKNDLWIAATAHVTGATLVITDNDFNHLDGKFLTLIKINTEIS